MKALKKFLQSVEHKFANKSILPKIAVVGDGMVDEYYQITSERISPEFPIPVMLSSNIKPDICRPGGTANILHQLKSYPCKVDYYGFYDSYSKSTFSMFDDFPNVNWETGRDISPAQIPVKRRMYHEDFPLIRWDVESPNYGLSDDDLFNYRMALNEKYTEEFYDVAILSDYGKGMFSEDIDLWMLGEEGPITIVDPKDGPLEKWKGCSIFKPNYAEACELTGETDWEKQCECIMEILECLAVVITCAGDGIVGQVMHRKFEYRPISKIKAKSVIGAGDCFASILSLGLALRHDIVDMAEIAFEAGLVYVGRSHNEPVTFEDLLDKINFQKSKVNKVRTVEQLAEEKSLVFTNGCFDIMHSGHVQCLRYAKTLGEKLVVAVNTDESVKMLNKGEDRPIVPFEQRLDLISELECVDYVIALEDETPQSLIEGIMPSKLCKGGYKLDDIVGDDVVGHENVYSFPLQEGLSTTNIVEKIKSSGNA